MKFDAKTAGTASGVMKVALDAGSCEGEAKGGKGLVPPVPAKLLQGLSKESGADPVPLSE